MQFDGQPVVAPSEKVVTDVVQDGGGGIVVTALAAQFELGQLRAEII